MGLQLFNFVYNTLMGRANNNVPNNSLFLPRALAGMKGSNGQPYLPLSANNWSLPNMSGAVDISNDMAAAWYNMYYSQLYNLSKQTPNPPTVTQQMIDDATAAVNYVYSGNPSGKPLTVVPCANCGPDLVVNNVEIQGLANLLVSGTAPQVTQTDTGYSSQITLTFNAYPSSGDSWNQPLALGGTQSATDSSNSQNFLGLNFTLTQCLNFVARRTTTPAIAPPPTLHLPPSTCAADGFDCQAGGVALISVSNAQAVANVTVSVSSDGSNLQISLQSLALQGTKGANPSFAFENLSWQEMSPTLSSNLTPFYKIWTQFFTNLLATPDAAAMLNGKINEALNSPSNLSQVETLLNQQLASAFNNIFGSSQVAKGSGDADSNPVDEYLFNRARAALNDQSSYVYLPALVLGSTSPTLEPYTATNLSIPGPFSTSVVGQTISISQIQIPNLQITGLSNLLAPASNIVFGANQQATANLLLATMNPGPSLTVNGQPRQVPNPPATASSPFSLNVQVGGNPPITVGGTLNLSLQNTSGQLGVDTTLNSTGDTPDQLQLNYSNISLVAGNGDINIQVTLSGPDALYSTFVDAVINQPQVIEAILSALNNYIGQNLGQISQSATTFARNALNNLGN